MTAPAVIAIIKAALEDSRIEEITARPGWTAQRIATQVEAEGWEFTRRETRDHPH